jgi:hypothetical protein
MKRVRVPALVLGAVLAGGMLLAAHAVAEEEITWVTVEGTAIMDKTNKEEARTLAREDALRRARAQVVGSSVSAESLAVNLKLSGGLVAVIPYVRVKETEIIEEGVVNAAPAESAASAQMYRVLMKTGMVEETTGTDPAFKLEASLNRTSFLDGEEMKIRMKATRDCYVAVFIIMEDGKVLRLLPNRFKNSILLKTGEPFSFPDEADKRRGMKLVVHMPDNKAGNESIYILALKQPFSYDADRFQEGIYGVYDGSTAFMNDLVQEIAGIPLKDRAEQFLQYQIRKDKGGAR